MSIVHGIFFEEKFIFLLLLLRCCDVVMYPVYKYHLDTRRCGPRQQSLDKTFIISFTKHRNMTQTSSKGDPASILCHYEKTYIRMNSFRNSMNLFQNGMNSFRFHNCEAQARVRQGLARDGPQGKRPQSLNPCLELTSKFVATHHPKFNFT